MKIGNINYFENLSDVKGDLESGAGECCFLVPKNDPVFMGSGKGSAEDHVANREEL